MLVASAATMLTPIEITAPSISPSTDTPVATKPAAPNTIPVTAASNADERAEYRRDHRLNQQRGHYWCARHAVGAEHPEFAGAVGDGACGGHRDLDHAHEQNRHRNQHDGAADLRRVAQ